MDDKEWLVGSLNRPGMTASHSGSRLRQSSSVRALSLAGTATDTVNSNSSTVS